MNYLLGRRSSKKSKQVRYVLLSLFLASCVATVFYWAMSPPDSTVDSSTGVETKLAAGAEYPMETSRAPSARPIYPYSVIPGGVRTAQELRETSAHDPIVAAHYAGFDFHHARVVTLRQPKLVYLSYRIGQKIYWTTKPVSLHKGETLITDGKITGRTRCANQVSVQPQKMTSPEEPLAKEFDQPIDSSMRIPIPENFRSALDSRPAPSALGPAAPPSLSASSLSPLPGGFLPVGSPLAPGGPGTSGGGSSGGGTPGGPGAGGPPGPGPGPGPAPPVSVPEPGISGLIVAEILAIGFYLGWVRWESRRRLINVRANSATKQDWWYTG